MLSSAEPRPARDALPASPAVPSNFRRNSNLAFELALTQFKLKYTGSVLGYVWSLIKPLMLFGTMWLVFDKLFKTGKASPNFTMQLLIAIVIWSFFAEATATAISSIAGSGNIIRKAYFPRWILVASSTFTALLTFVINFVLILVITTPLGGLHLGFSTLLVPVFIIELYVLVLGISLLLSSLFVFYRDVGHVWEIFSQVLFYGSTVVYPISLIGNHTLQRLVGLNPMAQIIEDIRRAMVTPEVPWMADVTGAGLYLVPLGIVVGVLALGAWVFHHLSPQFAENL